MSLKFVLAITISLSLCSMVKAQKRTIDHSGESFKSAGKIHNHARAEELVFYSSVDDPCSDVVTSLGFEERWGLIAGNNEFGDKEKAELLEFSGSASFQVTGVGGFFVMPAIVDDGEIFAKVYMMDPSTGGPGALSSTSRSLKMSELVPPSDSAVELTIFGFAEDQIPVIDYTSFFASFDFSALYASQDTAGLYHTMEECGSGADSWEKWVDNSWNSLDSSYDGGLRIDFLIVALVEFDDMTTADEYINDRNLLLYPASPNPGREQVRLNYGLEKGGAVAIEIFDVQGKLQKKINHDFRSTGRHQEEIDIQQFSGGTYFYRIATSQGSLLSKFVVQD